MNDIVSSITKNKVVGLESREAYIDKNPKLNMIRKKEGGRL